MIPRTGPRASATALSASASSGIVATRPSDAPCPGDHRRATTEKPASRSGSTNGVLSGLPCRPSRGRAARSGRHPSDRLIETVTRLLEGPTYQRSALARIARSRWRSSASTGGAFRNRRSTTPAARSASAIRVRPGRACAAGRGAIGLAMPTFVLFSALCLSWTGWGLLSDVGLYGYGPLERASSDSNAVLARRLAAGSSDQGGGALCAVRRSRSRAARTRTAPGRRLRVK